MLWILAKPRPTRTRQIIIFEVPNDPTHMVPCHSSHDGRVAFPEPVARVPGHSVRAVCKSAVLRHPENQELRFLLATMLEDSLVP